jgi:hypothetical protein
MIVKQAIPEAKGFDINQALSGVQAAAMKLAGMDFVIRYVPLNAADKAGHITNTELQALLSAGLAVLLVQNVDNPGWNPTAELGLAHGSYAVAYAKANGYPTGGPIYCDLEEVAAETTAQEVIDYCTNWYNAVTIGGYAAGLYCGWNIVLTAQQLYSDLPFKSYWKAYNFDEGVATRGFQIIQKVQQTIAGLTVDPDFIQADELSDLPIWVSPS